MNFLSLAGSGSGVLKNTSLPVWHQRVGINFKVAASVARVSGELITKLTIKEKEMLHHHHHHHLQLTASNIFFFCTFRSLTQESQAGSVTFVCHPAPWFALESRNDTVARSESLWVAVSVGTTIQPHHLPAVGSFSTKKTEGGRSPHEKTNTNPKNMIYKNHQRMNENTGYTQ